MICLDRVVVIRLTVRLVLTNGVFAQGLRSFLLGKSGVRNLLIRVFIDIFSCQIFNAKKVVQID